jgi:ATP phosphoribosyltransferase
LFAVPKKGRIYDQVVSLLKKCDIQYTRKNRLDIALASNFPIALVFLPASDIARFVGEGNVDLGITGQDIIAEAGVIDKVDELLPLGFGKCKLCIQVPVDSGINNADQLIGKRIVTSFDVIASGYFSGIQERAKSELKTSISFVSGSVEAACGLGLADGIVDLVESGETMRAAGLKAIETILSTETVLICNRSKHIDKSSEKYILIEKIRKRVKGVIDADRFVLCNYNIAKSKLASAIKITPGKKAPTLSPLEGTGSTEAWVAVSSMVEKNAIVSVMDKLEEVGATDLLVFGIENWRTEM